jgi:uncharacterized protein
MTKSWCSSVPAGVRLAVQVSPNAKKSEIVGILDDMLKIRLQAQPIEGKANEALTRFIADLLQVPKTAVCLTHGQSNKRKMLEIKSSTLTVDAVRNICFPATKK